MKRLTTGALIGVLALTVGLGAVARAADDAKAVKEKLQGTWKALVASRRGNEMPAEKLTTFTVTFAGDTMTIQPGAGRKPDSATITAIDTSKDPATIDLMAKEKAVGSFKLDGDALEIVYRPADDGKAERPTQFGTAKDVIYLKLARQK